VSSADAAPRGSRDHDPSARAFIDRSARACAWCDGPMPASSATGRRRRADAVTCSQRCRQNYAAWRIRTAAEDRAAEQMRFAYADPPYPGRARLYPEGEEVDHAALVERLVSEYPDGWALSTAADRLQAVLALCPAGVRIASWHCAVRRVRSARPLSAWGPLIVHGGRPHPRDKAQTVTDALDARGRHRAFPDAVIGMKPPAFALWLFGLLGARVGDTLVDLYPGSGAIGRAWREYADA
jgi:hypothetical protein